GYEKVLFPKGDTAAKIEGHQTLEEFKKQKEDRIKELEKPLNLLEKNIGKKIPLEFYTEILNFPKDLADKKFKEGKLVTKEYFNDIQSKSLDEIKTLKQELSDVESGQTQLSSIANFYENTVTNILKKNGYNPLDVTDEYGNKWNEVDLSNEVVNNTILLRETDITELLDVNEPEKLFIEDLNSKKNEDKELEYGTINEFVLFGNQDKTSYTAVEVLENIITNFNGFSETSEFFLERAKVLLAATKAKVKIVNEEDLKDKTTFMQYDPTTNTIEVSLNKIRTASTKFAVQGFMHEVTHSISVNAYLNPQTIEQKMFKEFIDEAYNSYIDRTDNKQAYGFNDPLEFIAEAYSNPRFQNHLKSLDNAETKGFWNKFINAIRRI